MTALLVRGGKPLTGSVEPSANKNAVLPVLCATLLSDAPITLRNVPEITDVTPHRRILRRARLDGELGQGRQAPRHRPFDDLAERQGAAAAGDARLDHDDPGPARRLGEARLEHEVKGCTLGAREIDPHVAVFRAFGADVGQPGHEIVFRVTGTGQAARMWLEYASVTTTENFILSALTVKGTSQIVNAACEPHVQEMCELPRAVRREDRRQGHLDGLGRGRDQARRRGLHLHRRLPRDRHLPRAVGGDRRRYRVRNGHPEHFDLIDRTFAKFGAEVRHEDGWSRLDAPERLKVEENFTSHLITKVEAAPWPYIPADLLPIFIALGVKAEGQMMFWNKVYEGGLTWHTELSLFGAHTLLCDPHRLITFGGDQLAPATVTSPYIIRVAIALLMVASSVEGESTILDADPIRRAHPGFVDNFVALGADVQWVS